MKCAIYARYSSDLQYDRSIDDQIRNCHRHAKQSGWIVLDGHVYTDRAISGTTVIGRTGLSELMKAAENRPRGFDYVLIDDTSRLSRDKIEQAEIIRDLRENGVHVYFVSDNIDTKDEVAEDVILPIYGIKDALYCRDLAKKTKRGMAGQVLKGFNPGGRLYGYTYTQLPDPSGTIDKKTRKVRSQGTEISINDGQAKIVKMVFSLYASGFGLKAIAAKLNDQGIDPPGKDTQEQKGVENPSWCPNAIRTMLRNPRYIGDWTWNKYQWIRKRKTGKRTRVPRPKDEWVEYKNENLAIIDRDLWDAVRARIKQNKHKYKSGGRTGKTKYLLSGLLKCGVCGANLIAVRIKGGKEVGYRCSFNWHRGASVCPNNVTILKSDIEDRVLDAVKNRILNPDFVSVVVGKVNQIIREHVAESQQGRADLIKRRKKITKEIYNLIDFIAQSGQPSPSIQRAIQEKESELAAVEDGIQAVDRRINTDEYKVDPQQISDWLTELDNLIKHDLPAARVAIAGLIGQLTAEPIGKDGKAGLILKGKPKIDGILGVIDESSTINNSGGRI